MDNDEKRKREKTSECEELEVPNPKLLVPDKVSTSSSSIYYNGVDEISVKWLYSPHTITALVIVIGVAIYSAFFIESKDTITNAKIGFIVAVLAFLLVGLQQFRDGPFIRPHPAFWRLVLSISVVYLVILVFILFQSKDDMRKLLGLLDSSLGIELPEKGYADNCELTISNFVSQIDIFVLAHVLGWFGRALILRDYWFCWILSILFEFCEYSFQHLLPNFAECWWDHWILDVLLCNWFGIYVGMKTCYYFEMKQYSWRGIKEIETTRGKIKRTVEQFTPHSWTKFEWGSMKSFKNFAAVLLMLGLALTLDLNGFFLKYFLWIPPEHPLITIRLVLLTAASAAGTREAYRYLTDNTCKKLGTQAWVAVATLAIELIICIKYSKGEFTESMPVKIKWAWIIVFILLIIFAVVQFYIMPKISKKKNNKNSSNDTKIESKEKTESKKEEKNIKNEEKDSKKEDKDSKKKKSKKSKKSNKKNN